MKAKDTEIKTLKSQISHLKSELYDSDVLVEEKEVVKFKPPSSLNIENFVENMVGLTQESIKKKIISDFFNPRSVLVEENFELKFPFNFTFHIKNIELFQTEMGLLIYDSY